MTSKLLRIVPVLVSLSIPAFAADPAPPAAGDHHAAESKDKKKKDEKKAEDGKKAEEPKKEEPKK
jgi:ribosomal protein L12E/L44/L45/RPP1/RPP2